MTLELEHVATGSRRSRWRWWGCCAAVVLFAAITGCASKPAVKGAKVAASEVRIYATPDLLQSQYRLVEHVWIDSWRSNFTYPSFGSDAAGMDAMKRVASGAGANGLINVICLDARSSPSGSPLLYCYGDAIRVN